MYRHLLILTLIVLLTASGYSTDNLPEQINTLRCGQGLSRLQAEEILEKTAILYSRELAAAGVLSHRDSFGNTALERYRRQQGTSPRIGEILAAGLDPGQILDGWLASNSHRRVILDPAWTHYGLGVCQLDNGAVYVMLFIEKKTKALQITRTDPGLRISGCFTIPEIAAALCQSGQEWFTAQSWQPDTGCFLFQLNFAVLPGCLQLGYRAKQEQFVITNVIYPHQW